MGAGGSLPAFVCAEAPAPPRRSWRRAAPMTAPWGPLPAAPAAGHGKGLCRPRAQVSSRPAAGVSGRGEGSGLVFTRFGVLPSPRPGCGSGQSPGCCRGRQSHGAERCGQSRGSPSGLGDGECSIRMRAACPTLTASPHCLGCMACSGPAPLPGMCAPAPALRGGRVQAVPRRPLTPCGFAKGSLGSPCATGCVWG